MPTKSVVYNEANLHVERLYYTGYAILQEGQPMCYQESPATGSSTKGFPFDVELPGAANLQTFAGILHPRSAGAVGPCFVDVIIPKRGDVIQVLCGKIMSNTTAPLVKASSLVKLNTAYPTAVYSVHSADSAASSNFSGFGAFIRASELHIGSTAAQASNATSYTGPILANLTMGEGIALQDGDTVTATALATRSLKWVKFL